MCRCCLSSSSLSLSLSLARGPIGHPDILASHSSLVPRRHPQTQTSAIASQRASPDARHRPRNAAGCSPPTARQPAMAWRASERLMDTIRHYAKFPATGVSLRQMVQFGDKPSTGACLVPQLTASPRRADPPQAPCSAPRSSSPRSCPFAWPTASRSSRTCPTASTTCPRYKRSRTGTPSRLRYTMPAPRLRSLAAALADRTLLRPHRKSHSCRGPTSAETFATA